PVLPTLSGNVVPLPLDAPRDQLLDMLEQVQPYDPAIAIERVLLMGDPAFEIRRASRLYHADVIVMGTHGRGGLPRLVMGSVAEQVSRSAECPVLTVRNNRAFAKKVSADAAKPAAVA